MGTPGRSRQIMVCGVAPLSIVRAERQAVAHALCKGHAKPCSSVVVQLEV